MKEEKKEIPSSSFFIAKKEGLCGMGNRQDVVVWLRKIKGCVKRVDR